MTLSANTRHPNRSDTFASGSSEPACDISRRDDLGELFLKIGERHRVDLIGGEVSPVDPLKVECPCGIAHQFCIEAEVSGHPSRRLNAVICSCTDNHDVLNILLSEAC